MATVNDDAAGVYTCTPFNRYGSMGSSEQTTVILQVSEASLQIHCMMSIKVLTVDQVRYISSFYKHPAATANSLSTPTVHAF